jgi:hypothetical protein
MPINKPMMANMIKQYGGKKGIDYYYGLETKAAEGKASPKMFPAAALKKRRKTLKKKSW